MSSRLVLVAVIWVVIFGGTGMFLRMDTPAAPSAAMHEPDVREAGGNFSLEITTSFALARDPFALTAGVENTDPLVVTLSGKELFSAESLPSGETLIISPLKGVVKGGNEFFVQASPPVDDTGQSHALRLRFLRGGAVLAEKTFWSDDGAAIAGALHVTVEDPS